MSKDFSSWVGNTSETTQILDSVHAHKIARALDVDVPMEGEALPHLWHWCFFNQMAPYEHTRKDGHEITGGFLPPLEGTNRMWAGGDVEFLKPLIVGKEATRKSRVSDIKIKEGTTGKLTFVSVEHEVVQDGEVAVRELQNIVYREPTPPKLHGKEHTGKGAWSTEILPTPTMLFRYSAVTANSHRIHYDVPYATKDEGYPDLVVHGPLTATFVVQGFEQAHPEVRVSRYKYRGVRPIICNIPYRVGGDFELPAEGGSVTSVCWAEQDGVLAHEGMISYESR